jgi:hypothetical protein
MPEQSRSSAEFWHQHFWRPKRLSVWAYELVRRLTKLKTISVPKLSEFERCELEKMPPYTDLNFEQKQILTHVFYAELESPQSQLEKILATAEETMLWQQGQPNKLGHWNQVEVLDKKYDESQKDLRQDAKNYIRRYWPLVKTAWLAMNQSEEIFRPNSLLVARHALSDFSFTKKQLVEALKRAKKLVKTSRKNP